ncbi:LysR substrate-binding domain-containing protein [Arthrobacter mobilis]|uniref:LysR family transcriptional regulator n=1 Tax=Arthrobacter mobilis TaxID=2724944 RepID=A0A7X6K373_9MICC|nr:LysR substrate-binding domain-containing protein [Arthrobacter mobilis]NKX53200.1 LysR family transcriptional regulator [Arthrobacter mobilis]
MPDFTFRQLQLFAALPDHATLSSAAAALHISESALSQAISALEQAVGEQLCVRRKARGLQLTPAGQFFAQGARRLLHDAEGLVSDLAGTAGRLRGPVKLGVFATFASTVVPPILAGFPARHPEVTVEVTVGTHDDLLPALDAGLLDLAIVYDMFLPRGYARLKIYDTELMAVLPPDHRLAKLDAVDLAELAPEPLIMYDSSPSTSNTDTVFAERGLQPNILTSMPQVVLVQALVGRGLGYALLMSRPHQPPQTIEGRQVVVRPLDPPASRTSVAAIWPEQTRLSARARALLSYAVEALHGPHAGTGTALE